MLRSHPPKKIKLILTCAFVITFHQLYSATRIVNVGLYRDQKTKAIILSPIEGTYEIISDDNYIYQLEKKDAIQVLEDENALHLKTLNKDLGRFISIKIVRKSNSATLKIKSLNPDSEERIYCDNFSISSDSKYLRITNHVDIEKYIAGVVESEAGSKQNLEYYKVQSIICRTYALNNLRRHSDEGFNLCDGTHCQVYFSKNKINPEISTATHITKGLVIVDSDINIITAAFHSNCGGQTLNAEDVWKYSLPYLKAVCDTFCTNQPHAYWRKILPMAYWLSYLEKKHNYPVNDSIYLACMLNYIPPPERNTHLINSDIPLLLKDLRKDLDLQSTTFAIMKVDADSILLSGNGFGHGVGLCQEGAMRMANLGYSFDKILRYYYTNIHLVNLSLLDFFKD